MGLKNMRFDPKERNELKKYQLEFGISQLNNFNTMKIKRIENSIYLKEHLSGLKNISFLNYKNDIDWNHQYFVIKINFDYKKFNKTIFENGIHAMEENVWNCLDYGYLIMNDKDNFNITKDNNKKILRIQNSSYLKKKHLDKIIKVIKKTIND